MSRINEGMYSSDDQTWMSPPELVRALLLFEGREKFDLDPACSIPNIPAYRHIFYPEKDGLVETWGGLLPHTLTFINPPYGDLLELFMRKICEEIHNGCRVWALIPSRTETNYQHDFGISQADFTVFIKGRLNFIQSEESKNARIEKRAIKLFQDNGALKDFEECRLEAKSIIESNNSAPFPAMLLYFGDDWMEKADRWIENPAWPGEIMVPIKVHRDYVVQKRLELFSNQLAVAS